MAVTHPTVKVNSNDLNELIQQLDQLPLTDKGFELDLRGYTSARPHIMTALTSYMYSKPDLPVDVYIPRSRDVHTYMTRMKFYEMNNFDVEYPYSERPAAGRFIELTPFNEDNQDAIVDNITRCLDRLRVSENMQRALSFSISEMIDNACRHSESQFDGIVCAQSFYNELHLAIADRGIGIPASLAEHPRCIGLSDEKILLESVKEKISSKLEKGGHLGNGLFRTNTIVQLARGELYIYSKNGLLTTTAGKTSARWNDFSWDGTIVHIVLPYIPEERWEEIFEIVFPDGVPLVPQLDEEDFF
ncbi:ATP-binding protein [Aneurinibacillus thermoaerophilus]|uniref:ATP-binding protein n=1 Tax=Aneurinibacillus thermoaerophilus TaxID=143495 RepID=UPI002E23E04D|nr:ATP-binding protein [Aneurinibacillus thermoaerophilus]